MKFWVYCNDKGEPYMSPTHKKFSMFKDKPAPYRVATQRYQTDGEVTQVKQFTIK